MLDIISMILEETFNFSYDVNHYFIGDYQYWKFVRTDALISVASSTSELVGEIVSISLRRRRNCCSCLVWRRYNVIESSAVSVNSLISDVDLSYLHLHIRIISSVVMSLKNKGSNQCCFEHLVVHKGLIIERSTLEMLNITDNT